MFKINEIFKSIQGEGSNTGKLSLFVRVYGCDYSCSFCDSSSASVWEAKNYIEYSEQQLIEKIESELKSTNITNIVLTGGNPLIYDFSKIIAHFKALNVTFEVETQGSKFSDWVKEVELITISPKFYHEKSFKDYKNFMENLSKDGEFFNFSIQLKFVVDTWQEFSCDIEKDFLKINECLNYFFSIEFDKSLKYSQEKAILQSKINSVYIHFVDRGADYDNRNYIKKFNDLYEYAINYDFIDISPKIKSKIKLGLQIHKLLEMR